MRSELGRTRAAPSRRRRRWTTALLLVGTLAASGCATWRGAQHYQAGTDALDAGAYGTAIVRLERARALVPQRSEVRNHLALAYLAEERPADALRELRTAIELDCGNDAARWNLRALEADLGLEPGEPWRSLHRTAP